MNRFLRLPMGWLAAATLCAVAVPSQATEPQAAGALAAKYTELRPRLHNNPFQRPLYLDSTESPGGAVTGDVYAVVDHPFATTGAALASASNWCDILLLPVNTKYCRASGRGEGSVLHVRIGRKHDQALDHAYPVEFLHRVVARNADYLQVELSADTGPLGTREYRIMLRAIPVEASRTFLHLSYSYTVGTMGRLAMQAYLGTTGKDKVGFTVTGKRPGGEPMHVGGMRGVIERNSMRYYLGIEAFLGALSAPPQAQLEKRLRDWFAATERYPRQLREIEQAEYLELKRKDYSLRQQG